MSNRNQRRIPEGIGIDDLTRFYRIGKTSDTDLLEYNTFTGSDIRPMMYVPPNPEAEEHQRLGVFKEFGDIQTITISSHRPVASARVMGNASPAGFASGVRTFAGTMIFNRVGQDAFLEGWSKSELERPDIFPFFVDQMPLFHIVLHAQNEMGMQASAAILDIKLSDWGTAYTIEDLVPEVTYTYHARYIHPFMDRDNWEHRIREAVSKMNASGLAASDLAPADTNHDVLESGTEIDSNGQLRTTTLPYGEI